MTNAERVELQIISAYLGNPLTEEQMEFASDFKRNIISFSDPGTGKTHTLIAGLIMAQKHHKIDGNTINCMSFTKAAVFEMKARYDKLCKRVSIPNTVKFNTFHSLSLRILKDAYPRMQVVNKHGLQDALDYLSRHMAELGVQGTDYNYAKKVMDAINSLNSALVFHPESVIKRYEFVELNMEFEIFQELRKHWFVRGITKNTIAKGDIPLYCLFALMSDESLVKKWKGRFQIMVADEFQDLSLLHLHILSFIANTLIVVGDMKQQIYHFNGACPQIVREYKKLRPDAVECNLTQSFRCANEIAEFATRVIKPNDRSVQCFTGMHTGGHINIAERRNLDWKAIAQGIYEDVSKNRLANARDVMFLYRNNASAIPIMEEFYQLGVPFRNTKFTTIMEVPIFKDLCILARAAWQPTDPTLIDRALRLFPEFKYAEITEVLGPVEVMQKTFKSLFSINYRYSEDSSYAILNAMQVASKKILEGKSAGIVLNNLLEVYDKFIIKGQWWRFDNTKEFYFNLVAPVCNAKDFPTLILEEEDKAIKNRDAIAANVGIRCYTIHSSKGLEADDVYILDCDDGIFPNIKKLNKKVKAGCTYDAACDVRAERNLLYVAITRAKDNVTISYSADKPTSLLMNPDSDDFADFDRVYANDKNDYDDAGAFFKLFRLGGNNSGGDN